MKNIFRSKAGKHELLLRSSATFVTPSKSATPSWPSVLWTFIAAFLSLCAVNAKTGSIAYRREMENL
jgi:hypothetical protein